MSIFLDKLTKRYDDHLMVNHVTLEIADGEFFVLLGSSGSGKTTILSLIAGLTPADDGAILLHGRDVTWLPPQQRNVGFVFQNYALFQYMNIAENVEFGLSIRKVPAAKRRRKGSELLEMVGLAGLGSRMPWQLSGGQQQRIALARALAYEPDVLLLDEPLGALDAKIRVELRRNLKSIQMQLGISTIFVTHDQEEAFALGDRIGVMSYGRLIEVGTPEQLYQKPQTEFVASSLGSANLLLGSMTPQGVKLGSSYFPSLKQPGQIPSDNRVQVLFRPEDVSLTHSEDQLEYPALGQTEVEEIAFAGANERLRLRMSPIPGVRAIAPAVAFGAKRFWVDATRSPEEANRFPLQVGDQAWVGIHRIHTLVHPGLSFLMIVDGSLRSRAALQLGGQIARLAHARVTLLGCNHPSEAIASFLEDARKQVGSGMASVETLQFAGSPAEAIAWTSAQGAHDLAIMGFGHQDDVKLAEKVLEVGEHHLLLVPHSQPVPTKALVCVATGEPGKDDILFAGRLIRHLSAEAGLLSILPAQPKGPEQRSQVERFLQGGVEALALSGVPANPVIRSGAVIEEIRKELVENKYDLLVMGSPLWNAWGRISLDGVVGEVLQGKTECATLIVRSVQQRTRGEMLGTRRKPANE